LVPEPQHEKRAKDRHNDPGGMKLRARLGTREDVRHESADNRTDDPESDRPHERHVHVHERFRSPPGDQTNDDVPNQMKHKFPPSKLESTGRISGPQAQKRGINHLTTKDTKQKK